VVGEGTTFRLTLRPASAAPPQPVARALKGRVLVVDDERDILAVMGRMLRNDYEVVVESDPEKALERLLGPEGHFDVVFCDVIMPKRNGVQLYRAVEAQRPELAARFVMMSGGDPMGEVREFLMGLKTPRLEKPFEAQQVREVAERLLSK
jgi:two-component system, NtrC family, sensor kinase